MLISIQGFAHGKINPPIDSLKADSLRTRSKKNQAPQENLRPVVVGLCVLFNKATRTNLALDYAFGKFGNRGSSRI